MRATALKVAFYAHNTLEFYAHNTLEFYGHKTLVKWCFMAIKLDFADCNVFIKSLLTPVKTP